MALTVAGDRLLINDTPLDMWGIRTASATMSDEQTEHLIAQFDDYKEHGVNAVAVYYCGCSGGYYDPFSADGSTLDPSHAHRMQRIADACEDHGMVLVAGIFYQRAPLQLEGRDAAIRAVQSAAKSLYGRPNVIVNIANEQNSKKWQDHRHIIDLNDPDEIISLCHVVHETDPDRLVGGGGYDHERNIDVGKADDVDILLFDTCNDERSLELYEQFVSSGIRKPIVNVELFGAWTKTEIPGVFPEQMKSCYLREVTEAAEAPGLSVFFHSNSWCQDVTNRYDLCGMGTVGDPGIRWYSDHVAEVRGLK